MKLSIILVSYNTKQLTLETLESVFLDRSMQKLTDQVEVIVVDNNSSDDSPAAISELFKKHKHVTLIKNKNNPGFGKANNQGVAKSKGEYILFLNSDTIVKAGALKQLIKTFEQHPINEVTADLSSHDTVTDRLGIVAAQLLNTDGTIQPQGGNLPTLGTVASQMLFLDDIPILGRLFASAQQSGRAALHARGTHLQPKGWVGGTAMCVRRQMIDEIGSFDEAIFMYSEDVELCIRAHHHHWDVAIDPQAKVIHLGSASSGSANALIGEFKGYIYIWSKHKPLWQTGLLKGLLWIGAALRWLVFSVLGNRQRASVYSRIIREVLS